MRGEAISEVVSPDLNSEDRAPLRPLPAFRRLETDIRNVLLPGSRIAGRTASRPAGTLIVRK
jgi:hypothetical protein